MSNSLSNNKYFNKLSVNKLEVNSLKVNDDTKTLKDILIKYINQFESSNFENSRQQAHKNLDTFEPDFITDFNFNNNKQVLINNVNGTTKLRIKEIKYLKFNLYRFIFENNLDTLLFTTYSKQQKYLRNIFKYESIKNVTNYMIEKETQMTVTFNDNTYLCILKDSGTVNNEEIYYDLDFILNFNKIINTSDFNISDTSKRFINIPEISNADIELVANYSRSIYNCGNSNTTVSLPQITSDNLSTLKKLLGNVTTVMCSPGGCVAMINANNVIKSLYDNNILYNDLTYYAGSGGTWFLYYACFQYQNTKSLKLYNYSDSKLY